MPTVVGLDLGQHSFRAIEIDKSKKGTFVVRSGIYDNPNINLGDNSKKDYSQAIKDFYKEVGFSTSKVVISLEEKDIFMRVIEVPHMNDKELKSSITFEAEQYIPHPIEEVNLSFQKLELPSNTEGKISVQLVAARKDIIKNYIQLVKGAHLTPVGVEPEALSVGRALSEKTESASFIVHIGFQKSLIIITYNGFVVFTRTLPIGGDSLTRAISQSLDLEYLQAEEYKKAYGLDPDQAEGKIFKVISPIFSNLLNEVNRAQLFFTSRNTGANISKAILSGGTALMPGLMLYFAKSLNMEVELANPFKNLDFSKDMLSRRSWHIEQGPLFSSAVGLALKEL